MWEVKTEKLLHAEVYKYQLTQEYQQLTFADILSLWYKNKDFCHFFSNLLAKAPFPAFFWECPPLHQASLSQPFEFVLVNSPQLSGIRADGQAFNAYFEQADEPVCDFMNLGGDAHLIAPLPEGRLDHYAHLATFVRQAEPSQQQAVWQRLAAVVKPKIGTKPLWISTSGLGIFFLHIRVDSRPKYYQFAPYRTF